MRDTKQKILEISLNLFSRKGFSAVSIREICGIVEIKESTIYYHFENKKAILDEILNQFENKATQMMKDLENGIQSQQQNFHDSLYHHVHQIFFEKYLMDDYCNQVIRLLLLEQFNDKNIQRIYQYWLFDLPLNFQSKIFSMVFPNEDSYELAMKYYAPIFLFAEKYLFIGELTDEKKQMFKDAALKHIEVFFKERGLD